MDYGKVNLLLRGRDQSLVLVSLSLRWWPWAPMVFWGLSSLQWVLDQLVPETLPGTETCWQVFDLRCSVDLTLAKGRQGKASPLLPDSVLSSLTAKQPPAWFISLGLQVRATLVTWWTKQETPCHLFRSFPRLSGPFSVFVYTFAKGVELLLLFYFFTGKFQGMISFQEVLQDPRQNKQKPPKYSLNFLPYSEVLLLSKGSTFQGEIQGSAAHACGLEYKCEWPTDCLLPNWKYSVGIYWHGIIPRRSKIERNLTAH